MSFFRIIRLDSIDGNIVYYVNQAVTRMKNPASKTLTGL